MDPDVRVLTLPGGRLECRPMPHSLRLSKRRTPKTFRIGLEPKSPEKAWTLLLLGLFFDDASSSSSSSFLGAITKHERRSIAQCPSAPFLRAELHRALPRSNSSGRPAPLERRPWRTGEDDAGNPSVFGFWTKSRVTWSKETAR